MTAIVTTFNRAATVRRAIDSVLNHTQPNVDVVVVDDGSTDGTDAALREYERSPRVLVVRHENNRGVTAAKNAGLDALPPDTRFTGFVDSDDAIYPECVQRLLRPMLEVPGRYSQVLGWYRDRAGGQPRGTAPVRDGMVTYEHALCGRLEGDFWHLAPRDLIDRYRFDERAAGGESSVWWPMLKQRPGYLLDVVVGEVDSSGSDRVSRRTYEPRSARRVMHAYLAVLDAVGEDMRRACPRRFAGLCAEASKWARLAGEGRLARTQARMAIRLAPSPRTVALSLAAYVPTPLMRKTAKAWARWHGSPTA